MSARLQSGLKGKSHEDKTESEYRVAAQCLFRPSFPTGILSKIPNRIFPQHEISGIRQEWGRGYKDTQTLARWWETGVNKSNWPWKMLEVSEQIIKIIKSIWKIESTAGIVPLVESENAHLAITAASLTLSENNVEDFERCIYKIEKLGMLPEEFNKI
jgi:hypothetical protein